MVSAELYHASVVSCGLARWFCSWVLTRCCYGIFNLLCRLAYVDSQDSDGIPREEVEVSEA